MFWASYIQTSSLRCWASLSSHFAGSLPPSSPTGFESWANPAPLGLSQIQSWRYRMVVGRSPASAILSIHCFWLLQGGCPHCQIIPGFPKLQITPHAEGDAWLLVLISPKHCKKHSTEIEKIFLCLSHTWPFRSGDPAAVNPKSKSQNPCIRISFYCHLIPQNRNQT